MEENTKKKKGFFSTLTGKPDKKMEEKANCGCCCCEGSASKGRDLEECRESESKDGKCC
ncbi:MAG: hypothetical protein JW724_01650 [Candidatus Altiarchaeota archaeon]|nr:hypothetical protein [Candidatus Altiarchaeota archaeon]